MFIILDLLQTIAILAILIMILAKVLRAPIGQSSGRQNKLLLDSCALIDGRILEIINAGFIQSKLIVPDFVVRELQMLADGQDARKRERARFGLDIIQKLQNNSKCTVEIFKDNIEHELTTDDRLVKAAKKISADLCTIDFNLNKVATIEGVRVLNVNELANAIRPVSLPGEIKRIKIVQKGSSKKQGVGYLDDGTMVVVEGAAGSQGKTIEVEVNRYIQTDAGKMLFAKMTNSTIKRVQKVNKT